MPTTTNTTDNITDFPPVPNVLFKEAMNLLRCSRSTIYRMMERGKLRGVKVGSTWRFDRSELLRIFEKPAA